MNISCHKCAISQTHHFLKPLSEVASTPATVGKAGFQADASALHKYPSDLTISLGRELWTFLRGKEGEHILSHRPDRNKHGTVG